MIRMLIFLMQTQIILENSLSQFYVLPLINKLEINNLNKVLLIYNLFYLKKLNDERLRI